MTLRLSERDRALLAGEEGQAAQTAMRVIVRMAEVTGAGELIDISRVHIDACGYPGEGAIKLAETLANQGGRVKVKTTMNAIAQSPQTPRLVQAFVRMGAVPTLTCAPYQLPDPPRCGEHIAWGESNAVAFANSVLGARTNRYGDGLEVCAALTGRVPLSGYHVTANRMGTMLVRLPELNDADSTLYPVLGYLIGGRVPKGVPVIEGIPPHPTEDHLKAFSAAIASSGGIAMYHMVGVTPEAPTVEAACSKTPDVVWDISIDDIRTSYMDLAGAQSGSIDAVVFGSPHLSVGEICSIARYVDGRRRHDKVQVIVTTSRHAYGEAQRLGMIDELERFGATCLTDTCSCFLDEPTIPAHAKVILTPSAKYAHYGPGLLQRKVYYASLEDCLDAALNGTFTRRMPKWIQ